MSKINSGPIVKKFGFAPEATMRKTSYYGKPYDETKVGVNFERKNKKESQAWLEMYRAFSLNYHVGLVLGIIGVGIFAFAFRC